MKHRILVVGLGKSGRALVEVLVKEGHEVAVYDSKPVTDFEKDFLKTLGVTTGYFAQVPEAMDFDYLAMSPGVSLDEPLVRAAVEKGIPLKGEIELAYERSKGEFVGITGTNGKTTTTTLTYEIFKAFYARVALAGNIGLPAVTQVTRAPEETIFITEISSFQLETIQSFRPRLGGILNITPDHLNRHRTLEAYIEAKLRIFENYDPADTRVLNYDDAFLRKYGSVFTAPSFSARPPSWTGVATWRRGGPSAATGEGVPSPSCRWRKSRSWEPTTWKTSWRPSASAFCTAFPPASWRRQ